MNVKVIYCSSDDGYRSELQAYANDNNKIYICIDTPDQPYTEMQFITLDKRTAIKLVKDLRREISYLIDSEDGNI